MPPNKEVIVRSIQMQDKNFDEAEAGSRVGLAIKGAAAEEMKRGFFICTPEDCEVSAKLTLSFEKNKFYPSELKEGLLYVTTGMQTVPAKITDMKENTITLELEKQIVYTNDGTFLLLDLNAKKLHVIGRGGSNKNFLGRFFAQVFLEDKKCRGSDSNARTSTGIDLESIAVDLAWLPLRKKSMNNLVIIKV
jgi:selenocysteine-specific translation elongation factor